jgi:cell wall-associated NlpC family hydrolase
MNKTTATHYFIAAALLLTAIISCAGQEQKSDTAVPADTATIATTVKDSVDNKPVPVTSTDKDTPVVTFIPPHPVFTLPDSIVAFARTLIGVPYLYASTDPSKGLDCSGFITCVFRHFNISVPRSSVDFTNYGKTITEQEARPGDLILFTGTDSTIRIVGHMGIVESVQHDTLHFIHSSSGKAKGVVISPLGNYYRRRFVKVIRVFAEGMFASFAEEIQQ